MKHDRSELWKQLTLVFLLSVAGVAPAAVDKAAHEVGNWAPPDVDQAVPPARTDVPCPLPEVLADASQRVEELVVNMQRFSATERAQFVEFDKKGVPHNIATAVFSYVAYIHEDRPGQLTVEEYRNDSVGVQSFPTRLAATGTAAFALIFHPLYIHDFTVTCEGLAYFNDTPAWQLHFVQLPDRSNNFRGYRLAAAYYPVKLKGRAWISKDSHEVLRLETDLLRPIQEIPLLREHISIDYGPVYFQNRDLKLWLPQSADIFMDYRAHRYHHQHSFSGFQLFWVDTEEKTKGPRQR